MTTSRSAAPGPSGAIGRLVGLARRRWGAMRALESLLFGLAAAGLTLAAGALSSARVLEPGALAAAAISGVLAALTWSLERARSPREMARRIDGALARDGDFVTAFEREPEVNSPLERALVARVAGAVGPAEVRRSVRAPSVALLAIPLAAAAALVLALEVGDRRGRRAGSLLRALSAELGSAAARSEAGGTEAGDEELAALAEAVRELAEQPRPAPELARELDRVAAELSERTGAAPEPLPELERALALCDRARLELGLEARPVAGEPAAGRIPATSRSGDLAESPGGDTMTGSRASAEGTGEGTSTAPEGAVTGPAPTPEAGVLAGRWWDERYDAVVTGWRTARERRDTP